MDTTGGVSMPKRAHAAPVMAVLAGADPFESMESRRRRLAPPSAPPAAQHAKACVVTHTAPLPPRLEAGAPSVQDGAWRNRFRLTHGQPMAVDSGSIVVG